MFMIKTKTWLAKHKVVATPAGEPRLKVVRYIGWLLAAYLLFIVVSQLLRAAELAESALDYCTNGQIGVLAFIAAFAIPFLVGMKSSTLMRCMSLAFGWMYAALFVAIVVMDASNNGLVGKLAFVSFAVLLAITTWGYWPFRSQDQQQKKSKNRKSPKRKS
jgi:hypothetical protein